MVPDVLNINQSLKEIEKLTKLQNCPNLILNPNKVSVMFVEHRQSLKEGLPLRSVCKQQVHLLLRCAPGWKEGSMRSL